MQCYSATKKTKYWYTLWLRWTWEHYATWRKPDPKGHIAYRDFSMKCPNGSMGRDKRQVSGQGGMRSDYLWVWSVFSVTVREFWNCRKVVVAQHCKFTKSTESCFKWLIVWSAKFSSGFYTSAVRGGGEKSRDFEFTAAWFWISSLPHSMYVTLGKGIRHTGLRLYRL